MSQWTEHVVQYNFPTRILSGAGARKRLKDELKSAKLKKPLLVTDRGVVALPFFKEIEKDLRSASLDVATYSGIWGNPTKSQAQMGIDAVRTHAADAVIAIGGGAAMDVAKIIALMAHHPGDIFDYEDGKPDGRAVDQKIPWIVAIPTTAGTGSEVGRSAVVSDDKTHIKKIIFSPRLLPSLVLADPELTTALPASITAATGLDAVTHLVEAYLAKGLQPLCDGIAQEGLRLVSQSLVTCVKHPGDIEARAKMLNAAMMGAVAFQKGLGATHSCAHALSTVCDLHHGLANGIMLPYILEFNLPECRERMKHMAYAVGAPDVSAEGFIAWIRNLNREIGIPAALKEVKVNADHIPQLIEIATQDGCHPFNPRAVSKTDFETIFKRALG